MSSKENKANAKKVKYLGRHIMIKGVFVDKILSGEKVSTIRVGIVKPKYREVIIHGGGRPIAKVKVTDVIYKKVKELDDNDAKRDGFNSKDELINALRKVYGNISPEDLVTIIKFEVVQRLDMLSTEDPYLGLEPADIARLGLRYLKDLLDERAVKILEDLTRTNSIRKTSLKLYGDIEKRWIVRKVLREVIRLLKARGVLRIRDN